MEKDFFSFAGRRLTSGPRRKSAGPASRARLASLGPAQRRAAPGLPPRACPLTRRAARPTAAELARRVAAMRRRRRRASQPACARAHAPAYTCRSQCARWLIPALPLLSARAERPQLCLSPRRAPAGGIRRGFPTSAGNPAPAAPPRPPSSCARICAAFRAQVEPPQPSHRRPWRRRARPPWKSPSSSSPALPSYPTAFAVFSRITCARQLALPWPEMAAGLVAEPCHRASASTGEALCLSQPGRPGRATVG